MMTLQFKNLIESHRLYEEAFTHKSLRKAENFERLEFLGDSLVGFLVTEALYKKHSKTSEGDLSRWKSVLIGQSSLADVCQNLDMQNHLICKASDFKHLAANERIRASLFESFLGAYYLIEGFEKTKTLVGELFKDKIEKASAIFSHADSKTLFQEAAQARLGETPTYQTLGKSGPSHSPIFKVGVCIKEKVYAEAEGESLKAAQKAAAGKALLKLKNEKPSKRSGGQS